jgi:hypothetical protein
MTANWAFAPVCGADFWRVIVTSPEVLIFLFFMITDPKTVPGGAVGRVVFGFLVAVASTLLLAPMTDEFGTKVALLSGLVAVCAARPIVDRLVPAPKSTADDIRGFGSRLVRGDAGAGVSLVRGILRVGLIGVAVLVLGVGIVVAGSPARLPVGLGSEALDGVPHQVDPSTFPPITVEQDVTDWNHSIAGPGAQEIALTLAENLELENQALLRGDASLLMAVDHGDRLKEMQARLADAKATGKVVVAHYRFDSMNVRLIVPFGVQTGLSLGFDSRGTVTEETYDASGAMISREQKPFAETFVTRRATGDRWLNVAVLPLDK